MHKRSVQGWKSKYLNDCCQDWLLIDATFWNALFLKLSVCLYNRYCEKVWRIFCEYWPYCWWKGDDEKNLSLMVYLCKRIREEGLTAEVLNEWKWRQKKVEKNWFSLYLSVLKNKILCYIVNNQHFYRWWIIK